MAEQTKTPNLEDSTVFQERAAQAMGGAPTHPAQFQPVGAAKPAIPGNTAAEPPQASRQPQTIFDVAPETVATRRKIDRARSELAQLASAIGSKGAAARSLLEDLTKTGKEESRKQDFDLKAAGEFVDKLLAAVEALNPKS